MRGTESSISTGLHGPHTCPPPRAKSTAGPWSPCAAANSPAQQKASISQGEINEREKPGKLRVATCNFSFQGKWCDGWLKLQPPYQAGPAAEDFVGQLGARWVAVRGLWRACRLRGPSQGPSPGKPPTEESSLPLHYFLSTGNV